MFSNRSDTCRKTNENKDEYIDHSLVFYIFALSWLTLLLTVLNSSLELQGSEDIMLKAHIDLTPPEPAMFNVPETDADYFFQDELY